MKIRALVVAATLFMTILGIGSQALAYSTPPSWLPMAMPGVTYDPATNKLAANPVAGGPSVLRANTAANGGVAPGIASFDPASPVSVLNNTAFSRRTGWWDPKEGDTTGLAILDQVRSVYGPGAYLWIQSLSQSPGLNTYLAVGYFGVNADSSLTFDPLNPTGVPYSPIFGTAGSSTKWQWDGVMDHNVYAVPFSFLTKPNQFFSAYYKIYIGDSVGNELRVDKNGTPVSSAAIDTTWPWQGPDFVFTSQTGVASGTVFESDIYTYAETITSDISITGGEYAISTDGGTSWGTWVNASSPVGKINTNDKVKVRQTSSANPGVTTTATLTIPGAYGPGTFSVTTLGPDTTPNAFSFTSQSGVSLGTFIESSIVTVSGINSPANISVSTGGEYAVSTDGASWGTWTSLAGTVANNNRVKMRLYSSTSEGVTSSATLTIGGVSAKFVVTTGTTVTPSLFFNSVTNAPANTSVSGMPFFVTSNAIAATTASTISVAGGITPQYSVSSNSGVSWSAWSNTTPATVAAGDLVRVQVVPATTPFTTSLTNLNLGSTVASFSVTTGFANPPSWMPMAMLNVAYDTAIKKLTVQDLNTHPSFPGTTLPALTYVPGGTYDPTKPWSVLDGGVALSRQLGWDDATALHGAGITIPGSILYTIQAAYPGGNIWIERISQSVGLETYFADGMFGVGGTGSGTSGSPQPYSDPATGLPIIYAPNYYGIFGTGSSSTKWKWDGTMIHNVYAVPAAFINQPNQVFTATYKVYVGDAAGNEIFNTDGSSTSTTEIWSWKGPATVPDAIPDVFIFTSQTGVLPSTLVESNSTTVAGLNVPSRITITGGEYAISTNGGTSWSAYSSANPRTVANGNLVKVRQTSSATTGATTITTLTIGGVSGTFSVTAVNRDGNSGTGSAPTIDDALKALQGYFDPNSLTPAEKILYDVAPLSASGIPQGNGTVDIADVILILRRTIGIGSW